MDDQKSVNSNNKPVNSLKILLIRASLEDSVSLQTIKSGLIVIAIIKDFVPGPAHMSRTVHSGFRSSANIGANEAPLTHKYSRRPLAMHKKD